MEKINFEDGIVLSPAKVTIDEADYEVKPAVYKGSTPLSAFILNKMQENIEVETNKLQSSITELQEQTSVLLNRIAMLEDNNEITLALNEDKQTTATSAYQSFAVELTKVISQVGTKLSIKNGQVLIGKGITKIAVSGKMQTQGDNTSYGLTIKKNSSEILNIYECNPGNSWNNLTAPEKIIDVAENDLISMNIYHNVSSSTKNIKSYNGGGTYMTVRVIE